MRKGLTTREQAIVDYANSLSKVEKLDMYMDYYIAMLCVKHNFVIRDLHRHPFTNGFSDDYETYHNILISHGKWDYISSFEDWVDEDKMVKTYDHGEDWDERGYARRYGVNISGIYWYVNVNYNEKFKGL